MTVEDNEVYSSKLKTLFAALLIFLLVGAYAWEEPHGDSQLIGVWTYHSGPSAFQELSFEVTDGVQNIHCNRKNQPSLKGTWRIDGKKLEIWSQDQLLQSLALVKVNNDTLVYREKDANQPTVFTSAPPTTEKR